VFMPNRLSGLLARVAAISVATLAFAGSALHAQTVPQLLPYTSRLIAGGGAGGGLAKGAFTPGQICPIAGAPNVATDAYGDGCLATEVQLVGPRYATFDTNGNVFFSDYTNGLIRRVDAVTGIITAVAGGATASPASGATCGTLKSTDALGDGCLGTAVKLSSPAGLAFVQCKSTLPCASANGNLYFSDVGTGEYNVRMIAATGGVITTTGVISLVDGDGGGTNATYGYTSNAGSLTTCAVAGSCINPATSGYLDDPYQLAFDANGNLYIGEEYKDAALVINTNTTGVSTVASISIPAGTIAKIAGSTSANNPICPNGPGASTVGCNYGLYTVGAAANASLLDAPFAVAADPSGNVYISDEYDNAIAKVSPAGIITTFAGELGTIGKNIANTKRAAAGSFAIGASYGVIADTIGNVYIPDETNGFVWRVDEPSNSMYVVAGGAATVCAAATDAFGDGCPALQAKFGSNGTYGTSSTASGIYGAYVDTNADVIVADGSNNLIREIASGTNFGVIGANQPTDIVDVHLASGDTPVSFTISSGSSNFTITNVAPAITNSDGTSDYLISIMATPSVLGQFTGMLQVVSTNAPISNPVLFPLTGIYASSPQTRTTIAATVASCSGTNTYATSVPVTLTATLISNGSSTPTGTYNFYANGSTTPLNTTPVALTNIGTTGAPVYGATYTYTFATAGSYSISATFTPTTGSYYLASTSTAPATVVSSAQSLTLTASSYQQNTVTAGQTALYSFTMPSVYIGTVSFAVTGLPANSTYGLSPSGTITLSGCQTTLTYALSIYTQQQTTVQPGGFASGHNRWSLIAAFAGVLMALAIGLRRRRIRFAQVWMVLALLLATSGTLACGKATGSVLQPATPAGTYTITVTATGSAGASPAPLTFQLTVH